MGTVVHVQLTVVCVCVCVQGGRDWATERKKGGADGIRDVDLEWGSECSGSETGLRGNKLRDEKNYGINAAKQTCNRLQRNTRDSPQPPW